MSQKNIKQPIYLSKDDLASIAVMYSALFKDIKGLKFEKKYQENKDVLDAIIKKRFDSLDTKIKKNIKLILRIYHNPVLYFLTTLRRYKKNKCDISYSKTRLQQLHKSLFKPIRSAMKVFDMFIIDCITCRYSDLKVGFLDIFNYHYRNDYIQKNHLKLPIITVPKNNIIQTDVVIVGSGAGGAVAAASFSRAGYRVVVVEKGQYQDRRDFSMNEGDARDLFDQSGIIRSKHNDLFMMCGKNLGGGSLLGWTSSFLTPTRIRNQWDAYSNLGTYFSSQAYADSMDVVSKKLNINQRSSFVSAKDDKLSIGLKKLGYSINITPRNVEGCYGNRCGFCVFGCKKGHKKSVLETWHREATEHGTMYLTNTFVSHVKHSDNKAQSVIAYHQGDAIEIQADHIVLAAGALATPAILQRSDIKLPMIGKNLSIHPTSMVLGKFKSIISPWEGAPQALYCDSELYRDGDQYGYMIQSAPLHPGLCMSWLGGSNAAIQKDIIKTFNHWTGALVMVGDRGNGQVNSISQTDYEWTYALSKKDTANMKHGIIQAVNSLYQAGAIQLVVLANPSLTWEKNKQPFELFLKQIDKVLGNSQRLNLGSFHQMGTARMGNNPQTSVCNQDGVVHTMSNLYVMDGSLLPRSSGVPPEVSIQSVVHMTVNRLLRRLEKKKTMKTSRVMEKK